MSARASGAFLTLWYPLGAAFGRNSSRRTRQGAAVAGGPAAGRFPAAARSVAAGAFPDGALAARTSTSAPAFPNWSTRPAAARASCAVPSSYPSRRDNLNENDPGAAGVIGTHLPRPKNRRFLGGRSRFCVRVEVSARKHTGNGEKRPQILVFQEVGRVIVRIPVQTDH